MKKNSFLSLIALITFFAPSLASAATTVNTEFGPNIKNLGEFLTKLFAWAVPITAGIAVIMFMYAGYLYITSQGDSSKISEAKEIIIGVIIGVMLLFTINVLMTQVLGTLR